MPYTADRPHRRSTNDELRARIPGWGADLDRKNRPAVPRERLDLVSGAHWVFPEQQEETVPRERSVEHEILTPVFGTSTPPRGLSGALRRYSYAQFSEGRAAHWLILMAADRVDAIESHLGSFLTLRPDNPITETGVLSEFSRHGISSRFGKKRTDLSHLWIDPIIIAGPWLLAGGLAFSAARAIVRRVRPKPLPPA
jgi:hypothetical protein